MENFHLDAEGSHHCSFYFKPSSLAFFQIDILIYLHPLDCLEIVNITTD